MPTVYSTYIDTGSLILDSIACDSFFWDPVIGGDGTIYYTSGLYTSTWPSVLQGGCDSVKVLNLTIKNSTSTDTSVIACD